MFVISTFSRRKGGQVVALDLVKVAARVAGRVAMRRRLARSFAGWLA